MLNSQSLVASGTSATPQQHLGESTCHLDLAEKPVAGLLALKPPAGLAAACDFLMFLSSALQGSLGFTLLRLLISRATCSKGRHRYCFAAYILFCKAL